MKNLSMSRSFRRWLNLKYLRIDCFDSITQLRLER